MASYKLIILLTVLLAVEVTFSSQLGDICNRPKNSFQTVEQVNTYLECIKTKATIRYGKRAPSLLAKLRPGFYDYENNLQQVYDMLYGEN